MVKVILFKKVYSFNFLCERAVPYIVAAVTVHKENDQNTNTKKPPLPPATPSTVAAKLD